MNGLLHGAGLWAMHPAFLQSLLQRGTIEAMLPDTLRQLAALGRAEAREASDPIRDGATVIVPVRGVLAPSGMGYSDGTVTDVLAARMHDFASDPKVGAIVLDIRSPGGLVFGTAEAADAIFAARQVKPVIAVANPFAFSAAYWLATQASAFYASTSAEVGSVGVRSGHVDRSALEEKIGLRTTLIASHPDKIEASPHAPLSDADREEIQRGVDEAAAAFTAAIARGRGIAPGEVAGIHGSGRIFSASAAAASGAIDGVMTLRDVVAKYGSSRSRLSLMRRRAAVAEVASAI